MLLQAAKLYFLLCYSLIRPMHKCELSAQKSLHVARDMRYIENYWKTDKFLVNDVLFTLCYLVYFSYL